MTELNDTKYNNLRQYLKSLQKIAIAFSGGVDSSLLLYLSKQILKDNVVAYTFRTPYIPEWEIEEAINFANTHGVKHKIIELPLLAEIKENPKDRCYKCKTHLFKTLLNEAKNDGFYQIADGTNFDDLNDFRPGFRALKELKIISPFLEIRVTKAEIRRYAKHFSLPFWEKPAYACLLTRIPYGQEIKNGELKRIERAELFLQSLGFSGCRVRIHGNLARIEINKEKFGQLLNLKTIDQILEQLRSIGFTYVTLDLEGYRSGSHNEAL